MTTEKWKPVKGLEMYEVSDLGRVRRRTGSPWAKAGKVLKPNVLRKGYLTVRLYKDGEQYDRLVHVLVAQEFIPNPLKLPQVNHLGDKGDCRATMLEWRSENGNMLHAVQTGRKAGDGVSFNKKAGKWRAGYCSSPNVRVYLGEFDTREEALAVRKKAVENIPNII